MADFDAEEYASAGPEEADPPDHEAEVYAAAGPTEATLDDHPAEEPQQGVTPASPSVTYNPLSGVLLQPNTVVRIDALNGALSFIFVKLGTDPRKIVVFDGVDFDPPFAGSTITVIPGGLRYNISHQAGWPVETAVFTTRVAGTGGIILL